MIANGLPPLPRTPGPRGPSQATPARNPLDRRFSHRHGVLAFLDDFAVPYNNNQTERDSRLLNVQRNRSGCFRREAGAVVFCRIRGVISTFAKQGPALRATLHARCADGALLVPTMT